MVGGLFFFCTIKNVINVCVYAHTGTHTSKYHSRLYTYIQPIPVFCIEEHIPQQIPWPNNYGQQQVLNGIYSLGSSFTLEDQLIL